MALIALFIVYFFRQGRRESFIRSHLPCNAYCFFLPSLPFVGELQQVGRLQLLLSVYLKHRRGQPSRLIPFGPVTHKLKSSEPGLLATEPVRGGVEELLFGKV